GEVPRTLETELRRGGQAPAATPRIPRMSAVRSPGGAGRTWWITSQSSYSAPAFVTLDPRAGIGQEVNVSRLRCGEITASRVCFNVMVNELMDRWFTTGL